MQCCLTVRDGTGRKASTIMLTDIYHTHNMHKQCMHDHTHAVYNSTQTLPIDCRHRQMPQPITHPPTTVLTNALAAEPHSNTCTRGKFTIQTKSSPITHPPCSHACGHSSKTLPAPHHRYDVPSALSLSPLVLGGPQQSNEHHHPALACMCDGTSHPTTK